MSPAGVSAIPSTSSEIQTAPSEGLFTRDPESRFTALFGTSIFIMVYLLP
jgi:hypothetical protein